MPIPSTRLLALLVETETARDALRALVEAVRTASVLHAQGIYSAEQALSAISAEAFGPAQAPTFEIAAVERAHWNRHGAANAAKAAYARARRANAALAEGRDPDRYAGATTAPDFIGHIRGAIPPQLRPYATPGASGPSALPQPAKPQGPTALIDALPVVPPTTFPIFPDTPPPPFTGWEPPAGAGPSAGWDEGTE